MKGTVLWIMAGGVLLLATAHAAAGERKHELSHVVQQRTPSSSAETPPGRPQGGPRRQGRVTADQDFNEPAAASVRRSPSPPSRPADGTSKTLLIGESATTRPRRSSGGPVPVPYPNIGNRPSSKHFVPEVDDEVLIALQSGKYRASGKYLIVSVPHRNPVVLEDGDYRTRSGGRFRVRHGRFIAGR